MMIPLYDTPPLFAEVQQMPAWIVLSTLGKGSHGEVFLARNQNNHLFALKRYYTKAEAGEAPEEVLPYLFDKEGVPYTARQEWEASQSLRHPNFVQVYQLIPGEETYLLMEWVDGTTLDKVPYEGLTKPIVVNLLLEAIQALHFAFENGRISHDLYSANAMADKNFHFKFIDLESFDELSDDEEESIEEYKEKVLHFLEMDILTLASFTEEERKAFLAVPFEGDENKVLTRADGPLFANFLQRLSTHVSKQTSLQ